MMKDYSNFNNIKLEEIPLFANYKTDTVYKYLKNNDISTLDELFTAYDNNSLYLSPIENVKKRTYGTIELLRYKYLGKPLRISCYYEMKVHTFFYKGKILDEFDEEMPLSTLGFSKSEIYSLCSILADCKDDLMLIELLYITLNYIKKRHLNDPHKDKSVISSHISFISKLEILISYYEKIHDMHSNMIEELERIKKLRNLFSELSRLKLEKSKIEELILQVENKIKEEIKDVKTK